MSLTLAAGTAAAEESETRTVYGKAGRAELTFSTVDESPIFDTRFNIRVKAFDTAKDDGCAEVRYSLVQDNSRDNEGPRVKACGTNEDSGAPKEFSDKPWFQHISGVRGWKVQVCEEQFGRDRCDDWSYFYPDGSPAPGKL